jgi:hypothetical protein
LSIVSWIVIASDSKLNRNWRANGRTTQATTTPMAKKRSATGTHGRTTRRSSGVRPGEMKAQTW